MECRWERDPRRPAVAGLERALLGGNRRGRSEGSAFVRLRRAKESGDQAAVNASRQSPPPSHRRVNKAQRPSLNPNGIPAISPALRRRSYAGDSPTESSTLKG